jgi:hypothetical protein
MSALLKILVGIWEGDSSLQITEGLVGGIQCGFLLYAFFAWVGQQTAFVICGVPV